MGAPWGEYRILQEGGVLPVMVSLALETPSSGGRGAVLAKASSAPLEGGLPGVGAAGQGRFGVWCVAVLTCEHPQEYLVCKTSPKYCAQQTVLRVQELLLLLIPLPGPSPAPSVPLPGQGSGMGPGGTRGSPPYGLARGEGLLPGSVG